MSPPDMPSIPPHWYTQIFGVEPPLDYSQLENGDKTPPPAVDRLVFIGETILELGSKEWLHERYRKHNYNSLKSKLANITSKKAGSWGKLYKLPSRVALSSTIAEPSTNKLSTVDLFLAYTGAIYLSQEGPGNNLAVAWVKSILDYEQEEGSAESEKENSAQYSSLQSAPRSSNGRSSGMIPADHTSNVSPRSLAPSRSPTEKSPTNAVSELNELMMKKGIHVNWKDAASGPDHARTWTVTAIVEEKEYVGVGHNKKQAKIAAAEQFLKLST